MSGGVGRWRTITVKQGVNKMLNVNELKQFVSVYLELVKQSRGLEVKPVKVVKSRRVKVRGRKKRGPGRPKGSRNVVVSDVITATQL